MGRRGIARRPKTGIAALEMQAGCCTGTQLCLRKATYRPYPTPKQAAALQELLRSHQPLYNAALEERIGCWRNTGQTRSFAAQCKSLTLLRKEVPKWAEGKLPALAVRSVNVRGSANG